MSHPTIMRGSTGQAVKDAQQNLVDRGYPVGATGVDGVFGFHTRHAVIMYQTDRSAGHALAFSFPLAIDGIVGPQTPGWTLTRSRKAIRGPAFVFCKAS